MSLGHAIARARRARARRRARPPWRADPITHRGIELSISVAGAGEIMREDSDFLYYLAMKRGAEQQCGFTCTSYPCAEHSWIELVGSGSPAAIQIRIRPALLSDLTDDS